MLTKYEFGQSWIVDNPRPSFSFSLLLSPRIEQALKAWMHALSGQSMDHTLSLRCTRAITPIRYHSKYLGCLDSLGFLNARLFHFLTKF